MWQVLLSITHLLLYATLGLFFSLNIFITDIFLVGRMISLGMKIVGRTRTANFWHSRKEVTLVKVLRSVHRMVFLMYFYWNLWYISASSWFWCRIHDHNSGGDIYLAFNAHEYFVDAVIPPPPQHKSWSRVVWILSDSANMFILSNLLFSPRMFKHQVSSCNSIVYYNFSVFVTWSG